MTTTTDTLAEALPPLPDAFTLADDRLCYTGEQMEAYARAALAQAEAKPAPAEPVAWTLQETLDKRETTCSARLWFTNPVNSAWAPLYAAPAAPAPLTLREQLDARTPWDELDAILTQNEKDAERYRWLRNENNDSAAAVIRDYGINDPAELDAFIDAAIAASKENTNG